MKLRLFALSLTAAAIAFAQIPAQSPPVTEDGFFKVHTFSNLGAGDSFINITNTGARDAGFATGTSASITGSICVNVYTFSADEQEVSCCSCPVTPNGLVSLSVRTDLISNTLTPAVPTSVVVKLTSTVPVGGSCSGSAAIGALGTTATPTFSNGLVAWGTGLHANTSVAAAAAPSFGVTETRFESGTLSAGELSRITTLCNFNVVNGSGFGVCRSCRLGGLGASTNNN